MNSLYLEAEVFKKAAFIFFIAFLNGGIIYNVYKKTYEGVFFSRGFCTSLILLPVIVSLIIITISNDLALSLGMIGALSIVRYRTPIKEPLDLLFIFWALSTGIASGAGYTLISLFFSSLVGAFLLIRKMLAKSFDTGSINDYLLILPFNIDSEEFQYSKVLDQIDSFSEKLILKSKIFETNFCELIVAVKLLPGKEKALLSKIESEWGKDTKWNCEPKLIFPSNESVSE